MILAGIPLFIGTCCRQWICAVGGSGRCGLCRERPRHRPHADDCCLMNYTCPTNGERECLDHGGFDVCCDHPECPGKRVDR